MDTYIDCDVCGERFWSDFQRYIRTVELPDGECQDVCTSCIEKKEDK